MTKVSSKFCYTIREDANPEKAYWLGFLLQPIMLDIFQAENGLELARSISRAFPEIVILQE